ncbi:MAG: porin [Hyphomicrobium sp.]|uniref:porin n=1 Tax=Hyphomicrobium sp. TaxID=82 RepID=UPI003D13A8D7
MREASMKPATRMALAAAASCLVWGTSVEAADLGGDCCADLEERIAELEATTARKGNRKVSLTVSGWVNETVMFWDDGVEQNAYVGTNTLEQSRFKFSGKAKINEDWSAGYTLEIGIKGGDLGDFSQTSDGNENSLAVRKAYWFIRSKQLGEVSVGQNGMATYHLLDDADGVNTRNYSDFEASTVFLGSFQTRVGGVLQGTANEWKDLFGGFNNGTPGQNGRRNTVRYDSPEIAGFVVTAAWGEDDMWDTKLAYAGVIGEFKVLAQVGYGESTDPGLAGVSGSGGCSKFDCQWWGAAGTILHQPTGLFVYGGYGAQQGEDLVGSGDTDDTYMIQAGIEQKFIPLGKTTIFGEYRHDEIETTGSKFDFYAAGIVQNLENAAMDLYAIYRHSEGENDALGDLDDFDTVLTGARIQF